MDQSHTEQALLNADRARMASALREATALLDTIIEESPIGFAYFDLDGRCQRINRALAEVNGVALDNSVGRSAPEVLPKLADTINSILAQVTTNRAAVRGVQIGGTFPSPPGGEREWLADFYPVLDSEGELIGTGVAALEVTPRRRVERRLREVISTLQASFLPTALPEHDELEFAVEYRAASDDTEIGGDFYDAALRPDGSVAVTIGDVCGHDIEAAVLTSVVRHTIGAAAQHFEHPDEVLRWANQAVHDHATEGRFASVAHGTVQVSVGDGSATLHLSLAGHPQPILLPADGGPPIEIGEVGTLLGVNATPKTQATRHRLGPGDQIVFYTDGLSDNAVPRLSAEALLALVGESRADSAVATAEGLMARYDGLAIRARCDDVAVLVVRRKRLSDGGDSAH